MQVRLERVGLLIQLVAHGNKRLHGTLIGQLWCNLKARDVSCFRKCAGYNEFVGAQKLKKYLFFREEHISRGGRRGFPESKKCGVSNCANGDVDGRDLWSGACSSQRRNNHCTGR